MKTEDIIKIFITIGAGSALLGFLGFVSRKFGKKKSDKIHRRYLGKLMNLVVVFIVIVLLLEIIYPDLNIHTTVLRGSALIVAIIGFAAQPAILDLICGFLISVNKPFEIGDRIIVEGIEPGIVEDITLRHTVIRIYDGLRIIVPNSTLNSKTLINTSKGNLRGIHLTYSVSYDTDVAAAIEAIRDCVAESPYTLPVETNGIMEDSGPVYFLQFGDSALLLETTIWISKESSSYYAVTDLNKRVNESFKQLGIEIPYNFVNVVEREYEASTSTSGRKKKTAPSKRAARTETVKISSDAGNIDSAIETARQFALKQRLSEKAAGQLEHIAEELITVMGSISEDTKAKFWIDGSGLKYRVHLSFPTSVGLEEYRRLLSLSTSGKNEAVKTLRSKILETMATGIRKNTHTGNNEYEWSIHEEPNAAKIGESILVALADDIKVNVTKQIVEILVVKSVQPE